MAETIPVGSVTIAQAALAGVAARGALVDGVIGLAASDGATLPRGAIGDGVALVTRGEALTATIGVVLAYGAPLDATAEAARRGAERAVLRATGLTLTATVLVLAVR